LKALVEIEITGDFEEGLTDDEVKQILDKVIEDGADLYYLTGKCELLKIYER
jgi:hypothetical protein